MGGTKEEIPSPLRPPTPPLPQLSTSVTAMKEKQKEEKESGEMTSINQGKLSTSGEVTGQGKVSASLFSLSKIEIFIYSISFHNRNISPIVVFFFGYKLPSLLTSLFIMLQSSSQIGTSSSPPALPSRDSQKIEGRESPFQVASMNKTELLQELSVTQCIRDGYEISRMAYTTCFPVCKKPNFIYLPQLRYYSFISTTVQQAVIATERKCSRNLENLRLE